MDASDWTRSNQFRAAGHFSWDEFLLRNPALGWRTAIALGYVHQVRIAAMAR